MNEQESDPLSAPRGIILWVPVGIIMWLLLILQIWICVRVFG